MKVDNKKCKNCDRPKATTEMAFLPIGNYTLLGDIPVCFNYTDRLDELANLVEADDDNDLDWNTKALYEQADYDCGKRSVNWYERAMKTARTIERLQNLAEHVVLSYDNGDKMTGFTVQEKFLAKELLRIIEDEESK
jgi:hypothetical protein